MIRNGGDRSFYPPPTWKENNVPNLKEKSTTRNGGTKRPTPASLGVKKTTDNRNFPATSVAIKAKKT